MMQQDKFQELKNKLERHAKEKGYILNPDEKNADMIINGLLKREEKVGYQYCPCRVASGDIEKDKDIICPCIFHVSEIEKDGHCKCRLFYAKAK